MGSKDLERNFSYLSFFHGQRNEGRIKAITLTSFHKLDILRYVLTLACAPSPAGAATTQSSSPSTPSLINHRNNSGNTPLHWAALNARFECVKALVNAGADITLKNLAGHDAAFLAERADWSPQDDKEDNKTGDYDTATQEQNRESQETPKPISRGMQVVEYLLGCEQGASLEKGAGGASESVDGPSSENQTGNDVGDTEDVTS